MIRSDGQVAASIQPGALIGVFGADCTGALRIRELRVGAAARCEQMFACVDKRAGRQLHNSSRGGAGHVSELQRAAGIELHALTEDACADECIHRPPQSLMHRELNVDTLRRADLFRRLGSVDRPIHPDLYGPVCQRPPVRVEPPDSHTRSRSFRRTRGGRRAACRCHLCS